MQFLPSSLVGCLDVVFQERSQASFAYNMLRICTMPINDDQYHMSLDLEIASLSYVFDNYTAKAVGHEYDRILTLNKFF